jgi:uncharacterized protein
MDRRHLLKAFGAWAATCAIARAVTPVNRAGLLVSAGLSQVGRTLAYDPGYSPIAYPGGDVPLARGVCTDVIIRAYRAALGIDLQKRVHEDMAAQFDRYPQNWGLRSPDSNIDHRRVPNLRRFFERQGAELAGRMPVHFTPGDIVTFKLPGNLDHVGLVSSNPAQQAQHFLVIHNIGRGAQEEDILTQFAITGHYRYSI